MKTTIDLPEDILHSAKIYSAQRKTTLKALVIEGLTLVTRGDNQHEANRKKVMEQLVKGLEAKNTSPMQPLSREEAHA